MKNDYLFFFSLFLGLALANSLGVVSTSVFLDLSFILYNRFMNFLILWGFMMRLQNFFITIGILR